MTIYGMNPSHHTWTGRQIVFADLVRRGRGFEKFDTNPKNAVGIGEAAPSPSGWPSEGAARVGVRVFGDMGECPSGTYYVRNAASGGLPKPTFQLRGRGVTQRPGAIDSWEVDGVLQGSAPLALVWTGYAEPELVIEGRPTLGKYDRQGMESFVPFRPQMLRTLDWSKCNRMRRTGERRVLPIDPLQGSERGMALEYQIEIANMGRVHLWYNVQPRYELSPADWAVQIGEELAILASRCVKPPILELGNELWNSDFAASQWVRKVAEARGVKWPVIVAEEIDRLYELAQEVFGPESPLSAPFHLFVGGHIQDPKPNSQVSDFETILKGLHFTPRLAGPATYVGPTKVDDTAWSQNGTVPSTDELFQSMFRRLDEIQDQLLLYKEICKRRGVAYLSVYEAGQSMNAEHAAWRQTGLAVQKLEGMARVYEALRDAHKFAGVTLANWYSLMTDQTPNAPLAPFGLLEGLSQPETPKARAARGG